jgi:hypothetical protein
MKNRMIRGIISVTLICGIMLTACQPDVPDAVVPDTLISIREISGVQKPQSGETPVAAITETAQYTGTVSWKDADGEIPATFISSTVYTATITLSPKAGYTLNGIPAACFSVADAATVTNAANSGVITAVFPETVKLNKELLVGQWYSAGRSIQFCADGTMYEFFEIFGSYEGYLFIRDEGVLQALGFSEGISYGNDLVELFLPLSTPLEIPVPYIATESTVESVLWSDGYRHLINPLSYSISGNKLTLGDETYIRCGEKPAILDYIQNDDSIPRTGSPSEIGSSLIDDTLVITGHAESGATVAATGENGEIYATAVANTDGSFTCPLPSVRMGVIYICAKALDKGWSNPATLFL